jgi:hypothetical protein
VSECHLDATNTEERQDRQSDMLSTSVTASTHMHSTYTTTRLRCFSNAVNVDHDQAPASETLPTDMSDTTESDAEKHEVTGVYVCVLCVCLCVYVFVCML